MNNPTVKSLLRLPDVCNMTGMSKSTVWNKLNPKSKYFDKDFPKQIKISGNIVAWSAEEVQAWIDAKRQQQRQGNA